jgi:ariadne-1
MEEMQKNSEFSWIEVQFLKKGLEVVLECRKTMKWTYAFAFYLQRNNQTHLFEDNQRDLEIAVESLNELIEKPLPEQDDPKQKDILADLKLQVLDKTEYCSRRRVIVLEDTWRGFQEGRWQYLEEV